MNKTEKFFVYGTLKIGGHFANDFDEFRISSKPSTIDDHALYNLGWFPTVVEEKGAQVHGELHEYKYPDAIMRALDHIEGYTGEQESDLYDRKKIKVTTEDGEVHEAYIYIFVQLLPSDAKKVESGIWGVP